MFVSTLSAELKVNGLLITSQDSTNLNLEIHVLGSILIFTAFSFHGFISTLCRPFVISRSIPHRFV